MNFCITGLPRSRTAWFAAYFTATGNTCIHEPQYETDAPGISDSILAFYDTPQRCVIIERDADEVKESLIREFGLDDSINQLIDMASKRLEEINGLRVKYEDINDRLQEIHEYCVDTPYNEEIADMFKNLNIQVKTVSVSPYYMRKVEGILWQHML